MNITHFRIVSEAFVPFLFENLSSKLARADKMIMRSAVLLSNFRNINTAKVDIRFFVSIFDVAEETGKLSARNSFVVWEIGRVGKLTHIVLRSEVLLNEPCQLSGGISFVE